MNRLFRYSNSTYRNLCKKNLKHQFAMNHALRIYRSNSIYSFIPKNACSTMRLSLALENQCIKSKDDFNWIHENNDTFRSDLASLVTANYTFVILRCPYTRLASCYLDKIVGRTSDTQKSLAVQQLEKMMDGFPDASKISFEIFVKLMKKAPIKKSNGHWRPQVNFLVYEEYDDYFCVEEFSKAIQCLEEKIGLSVVDARDLTKHGTNHLELAGDAGCYSSMSPDDIFSLKCSGKSPNPKLLYNDELISIVRECYSMDIELYSQIFGSKNLMFS